MKSLQSLLFCSVGMLLCFAFGTAAANDPDALTIHHSGFVGFEVGQIVHGYHNESIGLGEINRGWCERLLFQYANNVEVTDRIHVNMAIECQMSYSFPYTLYASWATKKPEFSFYPDRAEGTYTIGDPDRFRYEFGFGYFPYRMNPDVKNLGEYLFRTGTYPLYVLNNFNRPYARLLGLRSSVTVAKNAKLDMLLTSSKLVPPLADFSLSLIGRYNLLDILNVGAGVSFANIFPVDESLTTPTDNTTTRYVKENGDTAYYSFQGVKPTAMVSIDPKSIVNLFTDVMGNLFNKNDLKIYGEVCVSGWENYTNYDTSVVGKAQSYYENRADRTVAMFGMNIPSVFKPVGRIFEALDVPLPFLDYMDFDVLSLEWEYLPNKYPNSTFNMLGHTSKPVPQPTLFPSSGDEKVHDWYWTIYAKKTFLRNFSLIAQFARDHMRPINNDPGKQYVAEVLERKGDWWWNIRLNVNY